MGTRMTITLHRAERFQLWGHMVKTIKGDVNDDNAFFAVWGAGGYIGQLRPRESAELANIIERRRQKH